MQNVAIIVEALKQVCFCLGISVGLVFAALVAVVAKR